MSEKRNPGEKIVVYKLANSDEIAITLKMADQGRSDFCVAFTTSLCALESKQILKSLQFKVTWL